jgi:hypothetical protein
MQGIYTHIPETNQVPREHPVAANLGLLFLMLISLVPALIYNNNNNNNYYYYYAVFV